MKTIQILTAIIVIILNSCVSRVQNQSENENGYCVDSSIVEVTDEDSHGAFQQFIEESRLNSNKNTENGYCVDSSIVEVSDEDSHGAFQQFIEESQLNSNKNTELSAKKQESISGFVAKVYNEENIHFMNIMVDYETNKCLIQKYQEEILCIIIRRLAEIDRTKLYISIVPESYVINNTYDEKYEDTLIFDTENSLVSTYSDRTLRRIEFYNLMQNL